MRENGAASGAGVLATYEYDNLGRRTKLTRGNGVVTDYTFDGASRLTQMVDNLSGTSHDQTVTMSYNPAGLSANALKPRIWPDQKAMVASLKLGPPVFSVPAFADGQARSRSGRPRTTPMRSCRTTISTIQRSSTG